VLGSLELAQVERGLGVETVVVVELQRGLLEQLVLELASLGSDEVEPVEGSSIHIRSACPHEHLARLVEADIDLGLPSAGGNGVQTKVLSLGDNVLELGLNEESALRVIKVHGLEQ
jgi:hypothetical protein